MENTPEEQTPEIIKNIPTVFPLGFGVFQTESSDGLLLLDFIDRTGDPNKFVVVGSFALTQERAIELANALNEHILSNDDD